MPTSSKPWDSVFTQNSKKLSITHSNTYRWETGLRCHREVIMEKAGADRPLIINPLLCVWCAGPGPAADLKDVPRCPTLRSQQQLRWEVNSACRTASTATLQWEDNPAFCVCQGCYVLVPATSPGSGRAFITVRTGLCFSLPVLISQRSKSLVRTETNSPVTPLGQHFFSASFILSSRWSFQSLLLPSIAELIPRKSKCTFKSQRHLRREAGNQTKIRKSGLCPPPLSSDLFLVFGFPS